MYKSKRAFTLIELLVVVAVLGILVLLALPYLLGKIEKAREAKIVVDIKTAENLLMNDLGREENIMLGEKVEKSVLMRISDPNSHLAIKEIYNKRGVLNYFDPAEEYYYLNKEIISKSTNMSSGGVYIADNKLNGYYFKMEDLVGGLIPQDSVTHYESSDFEAIDKRVLGSIGLLLRENIKGLEENYSNPSIDIKIPKNTKNSGQVRTIKKQNYGSYEAEIKIPDNDGLLSGFFLYSQVDNNGYEIDIELAKNNGQWIIMTTIFNPTHPDYIALNEAVANSEHGVIFHKQFYMDFDPTDNFNNYKINLYEDYISFEVNHEELTRWTGDFDFEPMRLYMGSFYTHWLNKENYNTLSDQEKDELRNSGYEVYSSSGEFESKMNSLFGREEDYVMKVRDIKLNSVK